MYDYASVFSFLCYIDSYEGSDSGSGVHPLGNINAVEEYGAGVRVYGLNLSGNPAGCNKTAIAFPSASARTSDEQNRLNSMLLASFVSQQRVRVKLSDTECRENQPVYLSVRIEN